MGEEIPIREVLRDQVELLLIGEVAIELDYVLVVQTALNFDFSHHQFSGSWPFKTLPS